jgi:acetylornithine/N-succinyldiaminopimelate aminotransferase
MQNQVNHLMQLVQRPNVAMVRGKGPYLWDEDGRRYLDFVQGWAVNCLGHCPELVARALAEQMTALLNVGPAYYNAPALELSRRLAEVSGLEQVFFASSGAEANEGAVKLARKWGQKYRNGAYEVITALDSFHGRTLAMTSATGKPGFEHAFPPKVSGFPKVPYGDMGAVAAAITDSTAAVLVEPVQGEAGVVSPPSGYLAGLRQLCDQRDILLILDEVQTGMCRTGPWFAHQTDGIRPDIMTLGKGLGGGVPISALLANHRAACFDLGDHGGTFSGNALLCAAATAVFDTLADPRHQTLRKESAEYLREVLLQITNTHGATLRGRGHLWAVVLARPDAQKVRERAFELGLLINAPRPNIIRLMPALNVDRDAIDDMAVSLSRALVV